MQSPTPDTGIQCVDGSQNWHALFTRHQHEKSVAYALTSKGYEVYLPLYRAAHHWKDRLKELWLPLFSCYVFIRGGMERRLQIVRTPGILQIVGWGGQPAVIPVMQLDAVRKMIESSHSVEPHPFLTCGDRVRVINGPLAGVEGILVRKKGSVRLIVSVEMLGRSASVEIAGTDVVRTGSFPPPNVSNRLSASA
jgi:transcription antitermination factor NusG